MNDDLKNDTIEEPQINEDNIDSISSSGPDKDELIDMNGDIMAHLEMEIPPNL
jgi:hypothetical protein